MQKSPAVVQTAAERAARVVALYESGDLQGAAAALRAFRDEQSNADDYLPETVRAWARTVH